MVIKKDGPVQLWRAGDYEVLYTEYKSLLDKVAKVAGMPKFTRDNTTLYYTPTGASLAWQVSFSVKLLSKVKEIISDYTPPKYSETK